MPPYITFHITLKHGEINCGRGRGDRKNLQWFIIFCRLCEGHKFQAYRNCIYSLDFTDLSCFLSFKMTSSSRWQGLSAFAVAKGQSQRCSQSPRRLQSHRSQTSLVTWLLSAKLLMWVCWWKELLLTIVSSPASALLQLQ